MISAVGNLEMSQGTCLLSLAPKLACFQTILSTFLDSKSTEILNLTHFWPCEGWFWVWWVVEKIEFHKKTSFLDSTQYRLSNKTKIKLIHQVSSKIQTKGKKPVYFSLS